ncbi:molybdopterin-dependent oxidoreductase [Nocardioides sp.]|uniref:molybdopterin-dependent oxidoreductase n=1 Tax=Nocardioides sp. TaxID=35761 RepID=UPI00356808B4
MSNFRGAWSLAGLVAGVAGIATSYFAAMALTIRESPIVAVAEMIIRLTPGPIAEYLIDIVGQLDKPLLILGILLALVAIFTWVGRLARERWIAASMAYVLLSAVGVVAVATQPGAAAVDVIPVAVGFATWMLVLSLLTDPLRSAAADLPEAEPDSPEAESDSPGGVEGSEGTESVHLGSQTRRAFGMRAGLVIAGAGVLTVFGRVVGRGRRHVEEIRGLLRLEKVTRPALPAGVALDVKGITRWVTPNNRFYRIHTAIVVPAIEPAEWTLRIHGMVERELTLTYDDLLAREFTEDWITLSCVSNDVGGSLIGNAWWSGVRLAPILAEAGVLPGADAVLQTSEDGWNCGTPLSALTDDRNAMLAVAMNGHALPIDHGFPVRTIVPGLYGYVSATKWVVDMEVTRFADFSAFWTQRGWSEKGPVKMSSRIDVPRFGEEVQAGTVTFAGVAFEQHTGISGVEFQVDGGQWRPAELAKTPHEDTWVQWRGTAEVAAGDHLVRVRATNANGEAQIEAVADVLPDGATGYHSVEFTAG